MIAHFVIIVKLIFAVDVWGCIKYLKERGIKWEII
jgi:hypothetical protein